MAQVMRIYLALGLALVMVLTGHAAAAMKGGNAAVGQMVLCTGSGPVTVYTDSEGQPVEAPHHCPDCILHLLDAANLTGGLGLPLRGKQAPGPGFGAPLLARAAFIQAMARAPPIAV